MSKSQFKVLRVEETPEPVPAVQLHRFSDDVEHWRKLAMQTSDRLSIAEEQAKALREAADEARARFGKYKDRLDKAQARVNELQVEVVRLNAEREAWKARLAERDAQLLTQAEIAREFYTYRDALRETLDRMTWDLFVKLAVSPPSAGEENR